MNETRYFEVGEHFIKITFVDNKYNNLGMLTSFFPFMVGEKKDEELLLDIVIDDTTKPIEKSRRDRIRDFESGNGNIIVDLIEGGGYQFIFKDPRGAECGMFQIDKNCKNVLCALNGTFDMRKFGLQSTLMLCYAIAGSFKHTVMIHASLVRHNGYGYAFHAVSGTGKSTQVSNWLRHIPNCDLMNDDNPVIRVIDGKVFIYGSPWSGKTTCYRKIKAPLGALTRIDRDDHNWVEKLSPIQGFTSVLPSCSSLKWDIPVYRNVCDTVTKIVENVGTYILHCLPDKEAAEVCHAGIAVKA